MEWLKWSCLCQCTPDCCDFCLDVPPGTGARGNNCRHTFAVTTGDKPGNHTLPRPPTLGKLAAHGGLVPFIGLIRNQSNRRPQIVLAAHHHAVLGECARWLPDGIFSAGNLCHTKSIESSFTKCGTAGCIRQTAQA